MPQAWHSAGCARGTCNTISSSLTYQSSNFADLALPPQYYIALIREETNRTVGLQQPNIQSQIHHEGTQTNLYWGYFFKELNLPHGPAFDNMTLAEMAEREFRAITNILMRALA